MRAEDFIRMTNGGKSMEDLLENDELYGGAIHIIMENYAHLISDLRKVETVSACNLINNVLPENSVLFKDGHECWHYYYDDAQFDNNDEPLYSQELNETFEGFIRRVVKSLMCQEDFEEHEWPQVKIDLSLV